MFGLRRSSFKVSALALLVGIGASAFCGRSALALIGDPAPVTGYGLLEPTALAGGLLSSAAPYVTPLLIVGVVLSLALGVKRMITRKATSIGTRAVGFVAAGMALAAAGSAQAQTVISIPAGIEPTAMASALLTATAPYVTPLLIVGVVLALALGVKRMITRKATSIGTR